MITQLISLSDFEFFFNCPLEYDTVFSAFVKKKKKEMKDIREIILTDRER